MDDEEKDLRKEIEDLEKLIAEVKKQNEEEKKRLRGEKGPGNRKPIQINLAADYTGDLFANFIIGFLVNFILIFCLVTFLKLGEAKNIYIFLAVAGLFSLYETILKIVMYNRFQKMVLYSSGFIFFLTSLLFFYGVDLLVYPRSFNFSNNLYPLLFVFLFSILRVLLKNLYGLIVRHWFKKGPASK